MYNELAHNVYDNVSQFMFDASRIITTSYLKMEQNMCKSTFNVVARLDHLGIILNNI